MNSTNNALYNYCLRLADNNLILGQRLAEWCSQGPTLEEDLALTNISLDLIGQAESFYEFATTFTEANCTADDLAFLRSEREFVNNVLVEQPNGDFAYTIMKQFLFSTFAKHLYTALANSSNQTICGLATKGLKEVNYHYMHSSQWLIRLGNGTDKSKEKIQFAANDLWCFTKDMFEMNSVDTLLIEQNITINLSTIYTPWKMILSKFLK